MFCFSTNHTQCRGHCNNLHCYSIIIEYILLFNELESCVVSIPCFDSYTTLVALADLMLMFFINIQTETDQVRM